jgi:hypothetical protein
MFFSKNSAKIIMNSGLRIALAAFPIGFANCLEFEN